MKTLLNLSLALLFSILFVSCSYQKHSDYGRPDYLSDAITLSNNAKMLFQKGRISESVQAYSRAYELFTLADDEIGKIETCIGLSNCYLSENNTTASEHWIDKSVYLSKEHPEYQNTNLLLQIKYHFNQEHYELIVLFTRLGLTQNPTDEEKLLFLTYKVFSLQKQSSEINNDYSSLLTVLKGEEIKYSEQKLSNPLSLSFAYYTIAQIEKNRKNYNDATNYLTKALEIDKRFGNYAGVADDKFMLGINYKLLNKFENAEKSFFAAYEAYKFNGNDAFAWVARGYSTALRIKLDFKEENLKQDLDSILKKIGREDYRTDIKSCSK